MTRDEFKAAWSRARADWWRGCQSIGGVVFLPRHSVRREEMSPRIMYLNLTRVPHLGPVEDRQHYTARARAIRRSGYRDAWPKRGAA